MNGRLYDTTLSKPEGEIYDTILSRIIIHNWTSKFYFFNAKVDHIAFEPHLESETNK